MSNIIPSSGSSDSTEFDGGTITNPLIAPDVQTGGFLVSRNGVISTSQTLSFDNSWVLLSGSLNATLPVISSSDDGRDLWLWHDSGGTATILANTGQGIHNQTNPAAASFTLSNGEGAHLKSYYNAGTQYWLLIGLLSTTSKSYTGTVNANLFQGPFFLAQGANALLGAYGPDAGTSGRLRLSNSTESKFVDIRTNGAFGVSADLYIEDPGAATGYIRVSKNAKTLDLPPVAAPSNPSAGAVLYCDVADGHVRIKFSTGVVVDLTPLGP